MKKIYTRNVGRGNFEYLALELNIFEIRVEAGFAQSSTDPNEGMGEDGEVDPWS